MHRKEQHSLTNVSWFCLSAFHVMTTSNDSCEAGLLPLPPLRSRCIGSIQCGDRLAELSGWPNNWGRLRAGEALAFPPGKSNEIRHIGQVVCFSNHISIQERWKLCRHVGIIRRISFSSYSPKHMEHWASSFEWKASELYVIVGIAATTKGSNPLQVFWICWTKENEVCQVQNYQITVSILTHTITKPKHNFHD